MEDKLDKLLAGYRQRFDQERQLRSASRVQRAWRGYVQRRLVVEHKPP
jgi:hypothetical protein